MAVLGDDAVFRCDLAVKRGSSSVACHRAERGLPLVTICACAPAGLQLSTSGPPTRNSSMVCSSPGACIY
eukprot:1112707-Alexandrium_andersonii.AAC.1